MPTSAKFKFLERRIAVNETGDRFRVQYQKDGKATAKVFKDIEVARAFRKKTDKKGAEKNAPAEKAEKIKRAYKQRIPKINLKEIDIPGLNEVSSDSKMKLVERYLTIMEKILGI